MLSRQIKKYIVCFLGDGSIAKASKKFGITKMMLHISDKVYNRCPNKKSGRMTELTEEEEKSLKFYIEHGFHQPPSHHPLSIPTVKAFAWCITKKSQQPNCFNAKTGPADKWYNNFKKRNLDINTIQLCRANKIHLYCLPPHMTHIFQPLDVAIFHPVKSNFSCLTHSMSSLPHLDGKKHWETNFTKLFKEPWESMSTALIKTRFRNCGIYPLDRNTVNKNRLTQDQMYSACCNTKHNQALHYLIQFQLLHLSMKISQMKDHMKNHQQT